MNSEQIKRPFDCVEADPYSGLLYKKERPLDTALLVIHAGKALYLDHIGPGINYYLTECSHKGDEWSEPNGVYIWKGKFVSRVITYFEGDKDVEEELDGTLRLATPEEWQAYLNDEYAWDRGDWLAPEDKPC